MKYSTKVKIAVGIGFAFIIIMAIVMFVFVSNNSSSENSQSEEVSNETEAIENKEEFTNEIELYDITSFGIKETDEGTYLVKLTANLEEEAFVNLTKDDTLEFIAYDYSDGKVYIMYETDENNLQIYSIDLENYDEELVAEFENDYENSFTVYDEKIYYVTEEAVCEYDIENEEAEEIVTLSEDEEISNIQIDKENGIIYYMKNTYQEESYTACVYRSVIGNEEVEEILNIDTEGNEILLKDNYLICNIINGDYSLNYFYNIDDSSIWELGSSNSISSAYGNVAFTDEYVIFTDGEIIYLKDYDNIMTNDLEICEEGETILDIFIISSDIMQVRVSEDGEEVSKTYIVDFIYDILEDAEEGYSNILNIE